MEHQNLGYTYLILLAFLVVLYLVLEGAFFWDLSSQRRFLSSKLLFVPWSPTFSRDILFWSSSSSCRSRWSIRIWVSLTLSFWCFSSFSILFLKAPSSETYLHWENLQELKMRMLTRRFSHYAFITKAEFHGCSISRTRGWKRKIQRCTLSILMAFLDTLY